MKARPDYGHPCILGFAKIFRRREDALEHFLFILSQ